MLSHMLYKLYPDIEVNLCVIDPVPGLHAITRHESKVIPPNVNNMTCILMQDEVMPGFTPVDQEHMLIASPTTTKINYQVLRGHHGQATVGSGDPDLGSGDPDLESGRIIAHDTLYKFARNNGGRLDGDEPPPYGYFDGTNPPTVATTSPEVLTNTDRLIQYQRMHKNIDKFRDAHSPVRRHLDSSVSSGYYHKDPDFSSTKNIENYLQKNFLQLLITFLKLI